VAALPYDRQALYLDAIAAWADEDRNDDDGSIEYASAEARSIGLPTGEDRPGRRAARWVSTLYSYELHWSRAGHAPREKTRDASTLPEWERRLGEWARYQRRFERKLTSYQRVRLDRSPAFDWDPSEAAWDRALNEAIRIVISNGRLPYLNGDDPSEFAVARWLGRQLRRGQNGNLSARRATLLDGLLNLARAQSH
jgi:hypothetical protein